MSLNQIINPVALIDASFKNLNVDGNLQLEGSVAVGGNFDIDGDAEVNGQLEVNGLLTCESFRDERTTAFVGQSLAAAGVTKTSEFTTPFVVNALTTYTNTETQQIREVNLYWLSGTENSTIFYFDYQASFGEVLIFADTRLSFPGLNYSINGFFVGAGDGANTIRISFNNGAPVALVPSGVQMNATLKFVKTIA